MLNTFAHQASALETASEAQTMANRARRSNRSKKDRKTQGVTIDRREPLVTGAPRRENAQEHRWMDVQVDPHAPASPGTAAPASPGTAAPAGLDMVALTGPADTAKLVDPRARAGQGTATQTDQRARAGRGTAATSPRAPANPGTAASPSTAAPADRDMAQAQGQHRIARARLFRTLRNQRDASSELVNRENGLIAYRL